MKNLLIMGGSYFAGRVLVEELASQPDCNVYIFNRGRLPLAIDGITELVGDRENPDDIASQIPLLVWDAVIDFCAYEPDHIKKLLTSFVGEIRHFILISTTSVYSSIDAMWLTEDAPLLTEPQQALGDFADYGYLKLQTEIALIKCATNRGYHYTIIRPAIIYGFYNYAPRESYFFEKILSRQPVEVPENQAARYSFIWVVDMAKAIIDCLENNSVFSEIFNLASNEATSYRHILACLDKVVKGGIQTIIVNKYDAAQKGIEWPFPPDTNLLYSGAKLTQCLELEYTPFETGLLEALKYYYRANQSRFKAA